VLSCGTHLVHVQGPVHPGRQLAVLGGIRRRVAAAGGAQQQALHQAAALRRAPQLRRPRGRGRLRPAGDVQLELEHFQRLGEPATGGAAG
jgi:hypothetical protein